MFSVNSEIFRVSNSFDLEGRFNTISFEVIHNPAREIRVYPMKILISRLLELYAIRDWTMPMEEIEETMEKAKIIVLLKKDCQTCGFFAARHYQAAGYGDFYYLERLIVHPRVRLHAIVPLAALLAFNLPGFGTKELKICAISRLKVVMALVQFFGPDFFCSTHHVPSDQGINGRAEAYLAALSEKRQLVLSPDGLLKNIFNPSFTHDNDERIICGKASLSRYDAAFLMNTIPATKKGIFTNFFQSEAISKSRFIYSIVESLQNDGLFRKNQRRAA